MVCEVNIILLEEEKTHDFHQIVSMHVSITATILEGREGRSLQNGRCC